VNNSDDEGEVEMGKGGKGSKEKRGGSRKEQGR